MPGVEYCGSCGAAIIWFKHIETGKPAPIDAYPSPEGTICLGEHYGIVPKAERAAYAGRLHTSHFFSCPNATSWRKAGGRRNATPEGAK